MEDIQQIQYNIRKNSKWALKKITFLKNKNNLIKKIESEWNKRKY